MHTIRLRGPWQLEAIKRYVREADGSYLAAIDDLPAAASAKMPADWRDSLGPDFLGVVRYRRAFNRPTNLSQERVWLVVEPPRSCGLVRLNGEPLGEARFGSSPGRFDIRRLLKDYNAVEIQVEHPELDDEGRAADGIELVPGGLVGEVWLEIDE